jgi:hypothetical protein
MSCTRQTLVRNPERHPHLVQKTLQTALVLLQTSRQELQRDRLAELQVVGPVDLAHPTATEQTDDSIPLDQHRARNEAALVGRRRRNRARGPIHLDWRGA